MFSRIIVKNFKCFKNETVFDFRKTNYKLLKQNTKGKLLKGLLFVGDFIFKGTIGRWDLPTGNFEEMKKSILKLKNYSDRTILYPGHGDTTKLWDEKQMNPYIKNSL